MYKFYRISLKIQVNDHDSKLHYFHLNIQILIHLDPLKLSRHNINHLLFF